MLIQKTMKFCCFCENENERPTSIHIFNQTNINLIQVQKQKVINVKFYSTQKGRVTNAQVKFKIKENLMRVSFH